MFRSLNITSDPIDEVSLLRERRLSLMCGAVLVFSGIVRAEEKGEPIAGIDYEVFRQMAEHQFNRLFDTMESNWPIESVRLVHRVGRVHAGQASLWVELMAPHRQEALAAMEWLIAQMKQVVPIWKHPFS